MKTLNEVKGMLAVYGAGAGEALKEVLWPTRCAVCDTPGAVLCERCKNNLKFIDLWLACPVCGAAYGVAQCCECNAVMLKALSRNEVAFDGMASAVMFDSAASRIVRTWKDAGERKLASAMAEMMAGVVRPEWVSLHPVVVPVPATAAAIRKRGFDHCFELAQNVAALLCLRTRQLLAKPQTLDQRKLNRKQRALNLAGSFNVASNAERYACVLLVDDVCTTGATLNAACDALKKAGVSKVFCLTFARV